MFGEEFDKAKADEVARLKAQQEATQRDRDKDRTDPDNQVNGSEATNRGNLSNGNGPSEKVSKELAQDQIIRLTVRSYFPSLSQEEEDVLTDTVNNEIQQSYNILLKRRNRVLTEEDKIFFIANTVAKKAGVPVPATVADAVAAYQKTVAQLGSRLGLEGRPTEEIVEISSSLREYEVEAMMFDDPQLTEEGRINFAARIAAEIDARKAAATQLLTASTATVTHLAASAPAQVAEPIQKVTAKPPSVSLTAPVKATPALPPPPLQPSAEFINQKNGSLQHLQNQIAAARNELATHQETQARLQ